jgi:hypothetical protein
VAEFGDGECFTWSFPCGPDFTALRLAPLRDLGLAPSSAKRFTVSSIPQRIPATHSDVRLQPDPMVAVCPGARSVIEAVERRIEAVASRFLHWCASSFHRHRAGSPAPASARPTFRRCHLPNLQSFLGTWQTAVPDHARDRDRGMLIDILADDMLTVKTMAAAS